MRTGMPIMADAGKSRREDVYLIGITGGIAGGKSTVSNHLRALGATVIDSDAIAHALAAPNGALWHAYVEHFGDGILRADRTLDRPAIAAIVFSDVAERAWLNRMAHPLIRAEMCAEIEAAVMRGERVVFLEIPLLFEVGWDRLVHEVWVVDIEEDTQLERLMDRDGIDRDAALAKITSQLSRKEKCARADRIIDNNRDRSRIYAEVEHAYNEVMDQRKTGVYRCVQK